MNFLSRPWQRLMNESEFARTRRSLGRRLTPLERILDRSHREEFTLAGRRIHLIAGLGSSEQSILQLGSGILPAAVEFPERWLFLLQEGGWRPESGGGDQYSIARHVGRRLQIPLVERPFVAMSSEVVIEAARERGLGVGATEDDLYCAICYEHLPKPWMSGTMEQWLRSGEIHGVVRPRWEAMRIQREMHWRIDFERLVGLVTRLLDRIDHEHAAALEDFYEHKLRDLLRDTALAWNSERMRSLLSRHGERDEFLLLVDEAYLPVLLPWKTGDQGPEDLVPRGT